MAHNYNNFSFYNKNFTIIHTKQVYYKTAFGKSWKTKPAETITEIVTSEFYTNFVKSIPFFNSFGSCRASWNYTAAGYLPVDIVTISPDKNQKNIDSFKFNYNGK